MNKITSREALEAAYNASKGELMLRITDKHDLNSKKKDILCCGGTGCHASNSQEMMENLRKYIKENGLENDVRVVQTGCFGFCAQGPIVKIMPDNVFYVLISRNPNTAVSMEKIMPGILAPRALNPPALRKGTAR